MMKKMIGKYKMFSMISGIQLKTNLLKKIAAMAVILFIAVCFLQGTGNKNEMILTKLIEQRIDIMNDFYTGNITFDEASERLSQIEAENLLDSIGITVNKNTVPNETRSPFITSGIRIGTAAVTTRGFDIEAMKEIASIINDAIENRNSNLEVLRERVKTLCAKYPLYN